jgi:hypothetical protein
MLRLISIYALLADKPLIPTLIKPFHELTRLNNQMVDWARIVVALSQFVTPTKGLLTPRGNPHIEKPTALFWPSEHLTDLVNIDPKLCA